MSLVCRAPRGRSLKVGKPRALRARREFERVLREGTRFAGRLANVHLLPGGTETRVGFVCGRGVGGAVERNRARRLLREAWRSVCGRLSRGMDVVLVARAEIAEASTPEVVEDLARLLERAGTVRS